MKAIICDTCGASVPDNKDADIMPLNINYGFPCALKYIERDICKLCLEKLVLFFDPGQTNIAILKNEPFKQVSEVRPLINTFDEVFNGKTVFEESKPRTVVELKDEPGFLSHNPDPAEPETNFEVEEPDGIGRIIKFQPADEVREIKTKLCANCNQPFVPKNEKAKCCSTKCGQHKWYEDNKLKNETPEQKKIRTDELLSKLKKENPVKRNDERPSIYHEM